MPRGITTAQRVRQPGKRWGDAGKVIKPSNADRLWEAEYVLRRALEGGYFDDVLPRFPQHAIGKAWELLWDVYGETEVALCGHMGSNWQQAAYFIVRKKGGSK
jgi:hypothetical protein